MSRLRRTVAERLVEAQKTAAILTTFNEVDLSQVMNLRTQYKEMFKKKFDVNLGFMSFFTKAVCMALKDFPIINAQVDGNNILYHDYADIGVAVSTPKGLVVPVIRDAQDMSFCQIEKKILDLAIKGRDADLTPDEMSGGTFTITNGGTFGSMLSTPILNRPQSAILGMHNIVKRAVVVNDEIVIRPMMYLALSYDHRIIDGSGAVRFLVKIKECIEDPTRILLDI
jgi:2-oxoglutarate dehydrogenase E2 component (dihydrolipoamide succinyltransferase)